jgi:adenine-specific DNA methylase
MTDRRFIEESFPVREVGEISAKEKNIRSGHISTLHIWWARRPLAASRATVYSALVPAPKNIEEWQKQSDFIAELSKWENSNNQILLEKARRDILQAHAERLCIELGVNVTVQDIECGKYPRPRVLDPFAGGGSYPLEALRLGCETYASDYNPVAVLIEKATLEYPQKFSRPFVGMPIWAYPPKKNPIILNNASGQVIGEIKQAHLFDESSECEVDTFNPLQNAVRYWGNWVLENARKELAEFYPPDPDGSIPLGYIWARTIQCQNPSCQEDIPLLRQYWLAKNDKRKVAIYPCVINNKIMFRIIGEIKAMSNGDGYISWPEGFNPDKGTVNRAIVTCPACGSTIDDKTTRRLFFEGKSGQRLIAVIVHKSKVAGRLYRLPNDDDLERYKKASSALNEKRLYLLDSWGLDPIPDESIPPKESHRSVGSQLPLYGFKTWGDLFNVRQLLSLITLVEKIKAAFSMMSENTNNSDFCNAVTTYLAMTLDRVADSNSAQCWWQNSWEKEAITFARQALQMTWDYFESNPIGERGYRWASFIESTCHLFDELRTLSEENSKTVITQASAIQLPYPDKYFDAVFTDPPYYDNVPYSYLSDFYYVWLKRSLNHIHPELFSTPLTPKSNEIVVYIKSPTGESGKDFFERNLKLAFQELNRVLKQRGTAVIVYAHKSTAGWETVINALLDSGLIISSSWPLHTELSSRINANQTAALASSIYITSSKMSRQPTGFYIDVRAELLHHLTSKLQRLWEEGIGGADFFIAAIGSAIEVFGKYEQVIDYEGNIVRADRLLEEVRTIATDYAVRNILHNGFASEISDITRLYVLWRWNYGEALVPFDEGRKLAQSCGVDLTQEWGKGGFVKKEKEFIRLLGPQQRKLDDLDDPRNMIDVLHKALLLWEKGKRSEMVMTLTDRDYGRSEAFYRVAQAISETLPLESKEKKLLDGFLAGRERVQEEVGKVAKQGRMFE